MERILIVEDDAKLANELKIFLTNNGYEATIISDFENVLVNINNIEKDLILLDLNLPNIDGEYLCKNIRSTSDVPIIVVTSKNTELDELISINYGADDFVVKPYTPSILIARIERILYRRHNGFNNIEYKDMILDTSKCLIKKENKTIDLSKNEFKIMYYFLINKGRIITRDELMNYLWDNDDFVDDNTLTVNVNRLRLKLEELGYKDMIITKRKMGYLVNED